MKKITITFLMLLLIFSPLNAKVWEVPGECPTIQAAIDTCSTGDTILVSAGIYYENLVWPSTQSICLMSELGADSTIIDGNEARVFEITTGVDSTTLIKGFTIQGSDITSVGGGLYILDSSPLITNNIITGNYAHDGGGGVYVLDCSPSIINNVIIGNGSRVSGGGILCEGNSSPQILENNISVNWAAGKCGPGRGGGIACKQSSSPIIKNNTINLNHTSGIYCDASSPIIINNIFVGNAGFYGGMGTPGGAGGITCYNNSSPLIIGNNFFDNEGFDGGAICCWESSPTIIDNTINADTAYRGGGIFCLNSSPIITGNNINNNVAEYGGGIYCEDSSPIIRENAIDANTSEVGGGGGIRCINSSPTIIGNSISWNTAGWAGGIACYTISSPIISNNHIIGNTATNEAGGIECWNNSSPTIDSCVIASNNGDGISCDSASNPVINWNDIFNNTGYGVKNNDVAVIVNAENNWWGAQSGPGGIGSGTGDEVSEGVDYQPWLTQRAVPVELTSFTATTQAGKVILNWSTATETNNHGFEIERKTNNSDWIIRGFKNGSGTTTEPQNYSFIDDIVGIKTTSISYRLKQIDFNGSYEYSDEVLVDNLASVDYALQQNYPNPFNPNTTINYNLPKKSQAELVIYNALGESVTLLINEEKEAGRHSVEFNATNLPSGIYFYQLKAGDFVETKKMVLLK